MSPTWQSEAPPPHTRVSITGLFWFVLRAVPLTILVAVGLAATLLIRPFEALMFQRQRPVSSKITVWVCRLGLRLVGILYTRTGTPLSDNGIAVANHASWLDIFVLNSERPLYFVAKSEVASWPGIGWLARATGTVFIKRDRKHAAQHVETFQQRVSAGHHLLFFPEGTSSDGRQVLPFKPTLFEAFVGQNIKIQAISVRYVSPRGADPRFYGWWGDMSFGAHLYAVLASGQQGAVQVTYHPVIDMREVSDRKEIARELEELVRRPFLSNKP